MYDAKILQHSTSPQGVELVTFEVNYPHAVHKDVMTHRWARNFQSFRAVPPEVLLERLGRGEHFTPEVFGHRTKGMGQRNEPIEGQDAIDQDEARLIWASHVEDTLNKAERFLEMGIAKQQVNFLLQDLCFIRGIITTTLPQLHNFFGLRLALNESGDPIARPEVYKIADLMNRAWVNSNPWVINEGEWHLPLVNDQELYGDWDPLSEPDRIIEIDWEFWRKVSVGRCARVSYLTHDGVRDPMKDIALHDQLMYDGHMSPFEHQATPNELAHVENVAGSFGFGWTQYRKLIPGESNYNLLRKE